MNIIPEPILKLIKPGTKLIETHIDYVLVGPKYTYKIKKNVKYDFVDYTSLAKRKHFCFEELKLNRRYSPEIYLKVVSVKLSPTGKFTFGGKGQTIEYAVMMKTMPNDRRLDVLLAQNKVTPKMMQNIALEVLRFHRKASTSPRIQLFGSPSYRQKVVKQNLGGIKRIGNKVVKVDDYKKIERYLVGLIQRNHALFLRRMKTGKVRDLHGDLHSENIFYTKKPYIFDCIEFNQEFRYIDVAAEISFLLMELEFKGHIDLAKVFLTTYLENSQDWGILALLNFYKCHYASVRGLITALENKFSVSRKYLKLAVKYSKPRPLLIAVGGMIGSGKSTLAKKIATELGCPILQSDKIRKTLAHIPLYFRPNPASVKTIYSPSFTKKTYASMYDLAEKYLSAGKSVVLDASFARKELRRPLKSLAQNTNADLLFIETKASEKIILQRLKQREKEKRISDANSLVYYAFKKIYQSPKEYNPVCYNKSRLCHQNTTN